MGIGNRKKEKNYIINYEIKTTRLDPGLHLSFSVEVIIKTGLIAHRLILQHNYRCF